MTQQDKKSKKLNRDMARYHKLVEDEFNCPDCGKKTNRFNFNNHATSMFHRYAVLEKKHRELLIKYTSLEERSYNVSSSSDASL